ncbi:MAG: DnaB-like helicase C-terminal domain-containing protein, partial [Actinomycetota bacterium]
MAELKTDQAAAIRRSSTAPKTVFSVLAGLDEELRSGEGKTFVPIPTGFQALDHTLGGGVRAGDLVLVGGAPGVGKTIVALQWARNIALAGGTVIYACYEHEESAMLGRLLALELGELPQASEYDTELEAMRLGIQEIASGSNRSLTDVLQGEGMISRAYEHVESYGTRLWLVRASSAHTTIEKLEQMVADRRKADPHGNIVLVVDYLQKVAMHPEPEVEAEKITRVTESLKDMALGYKIPIISVVAADKEGLQSRRLRLHHLRGSSALMYECDVALILNDKFNTVSKVHLS